MSTYKGFTSVQLRKPKRSKFDLSHEKRISTRMGRLTPIFISETMPNDTFRVNSEVMLRLAPLLAPIMHRVNVFVHFFFVPNRLLWEDWEKFITGGRLGEAVTAPPIPPRVVIGDVMLEGVEAFAEGKLPDYLGIPPLADADSANWTQKTIDVMPFAAYYKCWYDYYRDRNYVPDNEILPLASGSMSAADFSADFVLKNRAWQHDYFTSALPFTQRGDEVLMPLTMNIDNNDITWSNPPLLVGTTAGAMTVNTDDEILGNGVVSTALQNIDAISADNATTSINDLRRAIKLQEWLERNALAGSRYNESIMAHFARKTSDARLQRAQYLGGGKVTVKISEVVTTAFSEDGAANNVPAGNMAGHGLTFGNTNSFKYNCEEHGFILGIMSVMPTSSYMQGLPRMFYNRRTFLDYPWPSFAHLGEQPVHEAEIFMSSTTVPNGTVEYSTFGYQSRYADWKYIHSSSHGAFRNSLDFWHLTRKFATKPVLGEAFVTFEDSLQDRIFAVSEVDTLWCYIYNNVQAVRSLPYFGTPML